MPRCPKCHEPVAREIPFCPVCNHEVIDQLPKMVKAAVTICVSTCFLLMIVVWLISNWH
jgi:hypothetical protein